MLNTVTALIISLYISGQNPNSEEAVFCNTQMHTVCIDVNYTKVLQKLGYYREDTANKKINLRNAILRFQSDCNITVDGVAGKQFKYALQKKNLTAGMNIYSDIVAQPPTSGKWITINTSKRILTVYSGKNVIKKYPVALGKSNDKMDTPHGKYKIKAKIKNPIWTSSDYKKIIKGGDKKNPLGRRWIGLNIKQGYTYGIHGNNSPFSIGRNVSKGCIRMINSDVEKLYEVLPKGTIVWIGTDVELMKWGVCQNNY